MPMNMGMLFNTGGDGTEMNEATRQKVADYVQQRVGGMVCPDHNKAPTVVCQGTRLDNISFEVEGCCQKVIHLVKTKLAE